MWCACCQAHVPQSQFSLSQQAKSFEVRSCVNCPGFGVSAEYYGSVLSSLLSIKLLPSLVAEVLDYVFPRFVRHLVPPLSVSAVRPRVFPLSLESILIEKNGPRNEKQSEDERNNNQPKCECHISHCNDTITDISSHSKLCFACLWIVHEFLQQHTIYSSVLETSVLWSCSPSFHARLLASFARDRCLEEGDEGSKLVFLLWPRYVQGPWRDHSPHAESIRASLREIKSRLYEFHFVPPGQSYRGYGSWGSSSGTFRNHHLLGLYALTDTRHDSENCCSGSHWLHNRGYLCYVGTTPWKIKPPTGTEMLERTCVNHWWNDAQEGIMFGFLHPPGGKAEFYPILCSILLTWFKQNQNLAAGVTQNYSIGLCFHQGTGFFDELGQVLWQYRVEGLDLLKDPNLQEIWKAYDLNEFIKPPETEPRGLREY